MTTETDTDLKLDDQEAKVFTIQEIYESLGKFPFAVLKVQTTNRTDIANLPPMTSANILGQGPEANFFFQDGEYPLLLDSRSWILLK